MMLWDCFKYKIWNIKIWNKKETKTARRWWQVTCCVQNRFWNRFYVWIRTLKFATIKWQMRCFTAIYNSFTFWNLSGICKLYFLPTVTLMLWIWTSAVKRLTAINRIQNKSFCLHNIWVFCVYLWCILSRGEESHDKLRSNNCPGGWIYWYAK